MASAAAGDTVVVGRIGRPQGVRGEVTVEVRTDAPDERFAVGVRLLTEPADRGPLTVQGARDHSGRLVVCFAGVTDRAAAEALRDTLLLVQIASLPPLDDPDEFHDWQLIGLRAELSDGTPVGTLADVLHLPHGDLLVVTDAGGQQALVPFVRAIVPDVDLAGCRVVLDPPPGLLGAADGTGEPAADGTGER